MLSRFLWGDDGAFGHAVEVTLKGVDAGGPETAEGVEPGVDFLEGLGAETVQSALSVDGGFDEARFTKDAQMLGDGGLGHLQLPLEVAHGLLGSGEEAEDGAPMGLGDDFEDRVHLLYIPLFVYTRQDIYKVGSFAADKSLLGKDGGRIHLQGAPRG